MQSTFGKHAGSTVLTWGVAALMLAAVMLVCTASAAYAGGYPPAWLETGKGTIGIQYTKGHNQFMVAVAKKYADAKPTNVKVSNGKAVKAIVQKSRIDVKLKKKPTANKPVTTKLSWRWKGKSHTVILKFYAWKCPVKKITVGGKKLDLRAFKKGPNSLDPVKKILLGSGKIKVTPAKGWKVKNIYTDSKTIKNGGKVSKRMESVEIELYHKKRNLKTVISLPRYATDKNGFMLDYE